MAAADHWRGARATARELHPQPDPLEGRREPKRSGACLVQGSGHRWRPRHWPADPLEGRVLPGDPDRDAERALDSVPGLIVADGAEP